MRRQGEVGAFLATLLLACCSASAAHTCNSSDEPCLALSETSVHPSTPTFTISWRRDAQWCGEVEYSEDGVKLDCVKDGGPIDRILITHERDIAGIFSTWETMFYNQARRPAQPVDTAEFYFFRKAPQTELLFSNLDRVARKRGLKGWEHCENPDWEYTTGQCVVPCESDSSVACGLRFRPSNQNCMLSSSGTYYAYLSGFSVFNGYSYVVAAFRSFEVYYGGESLGGYLGLIVGTMDMVVNAAETVGALLSGINTVKNTALDVVFNPMEYASKYINVPFIYSHEPDVEEGCALESADMCSRMLVELPEQTWFRGSEEVDIEGVCAEFVGRLADGEDRRRRSLLDAVLNIRQAVNRKVCVENCVKKAHHLRVSLDPKCRGARGLPGPTERELLCMGDTFSSVMGGKTVKEAFPDIDLWREKLHAGWDVDRTDSITFAFEKEDLSAAILNYYRPEWLEEADWKNLCPRNTALCIPPLCGALKPCVKVPAEGTDGVMTSRQYRDSVNVQLVTCTYGAKTEGWSTSMSCAMGVVDDAEFTPIQYAAGVKRRIGQSLLQFWRGKGITDCVMSHTTEDPDCNKRGGQVVPDHNGLQEGYEDVVAAMEAWWGEVNLPVSNKCKKQPYMSHKTIKCFENVFTELNKAKAVLEASRSPLESPNEDPSDLKQWLLDFEVQEELKKAFMHLASPSLRKEKYSSGMNFNDFVRNSEAPQFLSQRMVQEVSPYVWEVNSAMCEPTLEAIYMRVGILQMWFNTNNLHLHVVFPRPLSGCCDCTETGKSCYNKDVWINGQTFTCKDSCRDERHASKEAAVYANRAYELNTLLGSFVSHMNDYAAFGHYQYNTNNRYLCVFNDDLVAELRKAMAFGDKPLAAIEDKTGGHSWGDYKKAYIALRAGIYGNADRIGFEFRGGVAPMVKVEAMKLLDDQAIKASAGGVDYEHSLFIANILNLLTRMKLDSNEFGNLPVKLSVKQIGDRHRRNDIVLADVDKFQTEVRRVGWEHMAIAGPELGRDALFQDWCSGVAYKGGPYVLVQFAYDIDQKQIDSFRRRLGDAVNLSSQPKWRLDATCETTGKTKRLCSVVRISIVVAWAGDATREQVESAVEELHAKLRAEVAQTVASPEEINRVRLEQELASDVSRQPRNKKRNKGKGGHQKAPSVTVVGVTDGRDKLVESPNPRGCVAFKGIGHQVPYDMLRFSATLVATQQGIPQQCADDNDFGTAFSKVAQYFLSDDEELEHIINSNRVYQSVNAICKKEREMAPDQECSVKDTPDMVECFRDMWTRWSFVLLNVAAWEAFVTNNDGFRSSFKWGGKTYDTMSFTKRDMYTGFFMSDEVRRCTRRKCADLFVSFVHAMSRTELHERFLE